MWIDKWWLFLIMLVSTISKTGFNCFLQKWMCCVVCVFFPRKNESFKQPATIDFHQLPDSDDDDGKMEDHTLEDSKAKESSIDGNRLNQFHVRKRFCAKREGEVWKQQQHIRFCMFTFHKAHRSVRTIYCRSLIYIDRPNEKPRQLEVFFLLYLIICTFHRRSSTTVWREICNLLKEKIVVIYTINACHRW